jgi:hypothetical protein
LITILVFIGISSSIFLTIARAQHCNSSTYDIMLRQTVARQPAAARGWGSSYTTQTVVQH